MKHKYDVIIIGAGIIGSSIAYFLSQEKAKIALIDKEYIGNGSSGACDGYISLQSKRPGITLDLALESVEILKNITPQFERDLEFKLNGDLIILQTEFEKDAMEKKIKELIDRGIDVKLQDITETLQMEPYMNPNLLGSTYCPIGGQINPLSINMAYAESAISNGVEFFSRISAEMFLRKQGRIVGIRTNNGDEFYGDTIILATGLWTNNILQEIDINLPLKPRRGQLVVSEPVLPVINHIMLSGRYVLAKLYPEIMSDMSDPYNRLGVTFGLEQTESGNILIGTSREFVGDDTGTTYECVEHMLKLAAFMIPCLKDINIIRSFSGLRPYTSDGLPFISRLTPYDNLIVAAGHEGDGVTLSAITGKLVKQMVFKEEIYYNIEELSYLRINKKKPN